MMQWENMAGELIYYMLLSLDFIREQWGGEGTETCYAQGDMIRFGFFKGFFLHFGE